MAGSKLGGGPSILNKTLGQNRSESSFDPCPWVSLGVWDGVPRRYTVNNDFPRQGQARGGLGVFIHLEPLGRGRTRCLIGETRPTGREPDAIISTLPPRTTPVDLLGPIPSCPSPLRSCGAKYLPTGPSLYWPTAGLLLLLPQVRQSFFSHTTFQHLV